MTLIRSELIGFGHYLPAKVLTNDDMAKMVETNDEWISTVPALNPAMWLLKMNLLQIFL